MTEARPIEEPFHWKSCRLSRERIRAYVDAVGDPNPVHVDDAFARSRGFPSVIASGGMVVAMVGHCARVALAPKAVGRLTVRLISPAFPDDVVSVKAEHAYSAHGNDYPTLELVATAGDRVLARASASVQATT